MISEASTFLASLRAQVSQSRDLARVGDWLSRHTRHPKQRTSPWSFVDHEYQIEIVNDIRRDVVIRKCSQVGISELSVRLALASLSIFPGHTVIYTLPTAKFAGKFAKSRVDPVIEFSPTLSMQLFGAADSVELKRIGDSFLYLQGTTGTSAPISIPADMLIKDEVDFSDPDVLAQYSSRLGHAEDGGLVRSFSTPSVRGYGVSKLYEDSTQAVYMVRCNHCESHVWLDPFDAVVIPGFDGGIREFMPEDLARHGKSLSAAWLRCPACTRSISWARLSDPAQREWVEMCPGAERGGYQVYPYDVPKYNPLVKVLKQVDDYKRRADWFNFAWGVPYEDAETGFLSERCVTDPEVFSTNPARSVLSAGPSGSGGFALTKTETKTSFDIPTGLVAGVDVGKTSWFLAGKRVSNRRFEVVWAERIAPDGPSGLYDRVIELKFLLNIERLVIDSMPDWNTVQRLIEADSGSRIFACQYVRQVQGLQIYRLDEHERLVSLERTAHFDDVAREFNTGQIVFARTPETATVFEHCRAMKRVLRHGSTGMLSASWVSDGHNHFAHTLGYLMQADRMTQIVPTAPAPSLPMIHTVRLREHTPKLIYER